MTAEECARNILDAIEKKQRALIMTGTISNLH